MWSCSVIYSEFRNVSPPKVQNVLIVPAAVVSTNITPSKSITVICWSGYLDEPLSRIWITLLVVKSNSCVHSSILKMSSKLIKNLLTVQSVSPRFSWSNIKMIIGIDRLTYQLPHFITVYNFTGDMRKRGLCCRPVSVRLSVTFVYCIQMTEVIINLLSRPGSPIILFLTPCSSSVTQFQGEPLQWGFEYTGVGKMCEFRLNSPFISGNGTR